MGPVGTAVAVTVLPALVTGVVCLVRLVAGTPHVVAPPTPVTTS
jgi:hypothetical protein